MSKKILAIKKSFGNRVQGTKFMEKMVYQTVMIFPDEIIDQISKNCWFLGSFNDAYAYTFKGNDLKDKFLVIISDDLLTKSVPVIKYTIAHEIGHIILKHNNAVDINLHGSIVRKQEREAKEFAIHYLKKSNPD